MPLSKNKVSVPAERRSYHQFCGLARALDVVGERWTLLIVRDLLLGPRRYSDLLDELPGLTTNLLAKRLAELESAGLVARARAPKPAPAALWALTAAGAALEPAIMELARWGGRYLAGGPQPDDRLDVGWALLSMKRRYRAPGIRRESVFVALDIDGREFELELAALRLEVRERRCDRPDVALKCTVGAFQALFYRRAAVDGLVASGALTVVKGEPSRLLDALLPPEAAHQPLPGQVRTEP